jgi:hypothetical protein
MDSVNKETARYIIVYFSKLMTQAEKLALRHQHSTVKLEGSVNENMAKVYYRNGWLSYDPEVLNLLAQGHDQFMINCAERILKESGDKVLLNLCPVCEKLARTPDAKQCRFCGHDWHSNR